jgi:putative transposase
MRQGIFPMGDTEMATRGRPSTPLVLNEDEKLQLQSMARSRSLPAGLCMRARIVLQCAAGGTMRGTASKLDIDAKTVWKWRSRFVEHRLAGLHDELRPGKPRSIDDEQVAELIHTTLHTRPSNGSTHWSVRSMAAETGISKSSVQRYFSLFGLQPHRSKSFKLSTDPFFIEKLRDVVGLYLSPPENALVLCVDEKSQCQALERTQPMLPMIDQAVPAELDIHCIVDNYASHSHPKVKAWLASRPRWQLHFIPTYSSWLNQVERFFGLITDKAIRRGSFTSVKQLVQRIDQFVTSYNQNCEPFRWTATAESILGKISRLCGRISGTGH